MQGIVILGLLFGVLWFILGTVQETGQKRGLYRVSREKAVKLEKNKDSREKLKRELKKHRKGES